MSRHLLCYAVNLSHKVFTLNTSFSKHGFFAAPHRAKALFYFFGHHVRAFILGIEPEVYIFAIARDAFFKLSSMRAGKYFFILHSRFFNETLLYAVHEYLPDLLRLV
jgi:hypothetical protein